MPKNILVTGASGYLGSQIVIALVNKGFNVIILKRKTSALSRISYVIEHIKCYDVEDADFENIIALNRVDTIIHTATAYGRKGESLSEQFQANVAFPIALAEAAIKCKVKLFLNTDTCLPKYLNAYSLSKFQFNEWLGLMKNQINIVNMIPEYFYGPEDDNWKLISMLIEKLLAGQAYIDFTDGLQKRDFVYITDVVEAYLKVLTLSFSSETKTPLNFPISTGNRIAIKDLAILCKQLLNNTITDLRFGVLPNRNNESDIILSNYNLLEIGWVPLINLNEGLKLTIDSFKSKMR